MAEWRDCGGGMMMGRATATARKREGFFGWLFLVALRGVFES